MDENLVNQRKKASDLSLGKSDKELYQKALALMKNYCRSKSHLDFGSGRGDLLLEILNQFPEINLTGADLMEKPVQFSEKINWLACDLNAALNLPTESFDSITAIEVIEHLENPRHVFREFYRVLKKDGILILSTPNNESWRSILSYIVRSHFVAFTESSYPAHITALNRQDLNNCANEAGFNFIECSYSLSGSIPTLTQYTWQSMSFGILDGLRFTDNVFVVFKK